MMRLDTPRSPRQFIEQPALATAIGATPASIAASGIGLAKFGVDAIIACLALLCGAPAWAHHSFSAEFDGNKPVRLVGTITRIEWTNPHSYFYLDVRNLQGSISNWGCETGNPGALSRRGWRRGDIKIGDKLIVDGYLAKDGSHLIDARRVTLPDGRSVYGGSSGDGGPQEKRPAKP